MVQRLTPSIAKSSRELDRFDTLWKLLGRLPPQDWRFNGSARETSTYDPVWPIARRKTWTNSFNTDLGEVRVVISHTRTEHTYFNRYGTKRIGTEDENVCVLNASYQGQTILEEEFIEKRVTRIRWFGFSVKEESFQQGNTKVMSLYHHVRQGLRSHWIKDEDKPIEEGLTHLDGMLESL